MSHIDQLSIREHLIDATKFSTKDTVCITSDILTGKHGRTINYNSSYRRLVSGGGAKYGNFPIHAMVGESRPGCPGDKVRECIGGGGRGDGYIRIGGRAIFR